MIQQLSAQKRTCSGNGRRSKPLKKNKPVKKKKIKKIKRIKRINKPFKKKVLVRDSKIQIKKNARGLKVLPWIPFPKACQDY
jgi:hypothetical protein